MADKELGYVYILTNPSFREDWNSSGAFQGAKYFLYNGKVLDEMRKEKDAHVWS